MAVELSDGRGWAWECEDDLEAYGLELVLTRAGVPCEVEFAANGRPGRGAPRLKVTGGEPRAQVESLTSAMLAHYAQGEVKARAERLERRERTGRRALITMAAVGCVLCLVAFVASF